MRGTPCSVKAPDTTGFFELVRVMYRRQASETCASMSSLVEKAVARYGMLASPSPSRTYSTKSVEFARRVSPVRWSSTLRPDEPGTKWTRSPPMSACGLAVPVVQPERRRRRRDRRLDDVAREEDPLAARVERQPVVEQAAAHLRPADLHPDLGQDAHRLVDDPADELGVEDVEGRPHASSSGRCRDGRHQRTRTAARGDEALDGGGDDMPAMVRDGILLPLASRLMRPPVPSGATAGACRRVYGAGHQTVALGTVGEDEHDVGRGRVHRDRVAPLTVHSRTRRSAVSHLVVRDVVAADR